MPIFMIMPRYHHNYALFYQLLDSNFFTRCRISLSWEKPLEKTMAPGSILIISIYITLFTCFALLCLLLFTLHLSIKNTKNIISIRSHSRKWPWRHWQPLSVGCELLSFCVGTRDLCVVSYWIYTLVLKNWGKYLRYFTASSSPLWGNPTQCSRGSSLRLAKELGIRRILCYGNSDLVVQ